MENRLLFLRIVCFLCGLSAFFVDYLLFVLIIHK